MYLVKLEQIIFTMHLYMYVRVRCYKFVKYSSNIVVVITETSFKGNYPDSNGPENMYILIVMLGSFPHDKLTYTVDSCYLEVQRTLKYFEISVPPHTRT